MTCDEERLAEAVAVRRIYGDTAPLHVAGRIGALALEDDADGVARWLQIASRLNALRRSSPQ